MKGFKMSTITEVMNKWHEIQTCEIKNLNFTFGEFEELKFQLNDEDFETFDKWHKAQKL